MTFATGGWRALLCALALVVVLPAAARAQLPGLPPVLPQPPGEEQPPGRPGNPQPPLPAAPANGQATEVRIDAGRTNHSKDDTLIPPLERRWRRKLENVRDVLIGDRSVFARLGGGQVIALAGRSGRTLWSSTAPGGGASAISFEGDRLVVLGNDGNVLALDGASGRVLWQKPLLPRGATERIVTTSGLAIIPGDNAVFALSLTDGSIRWKSEVTAGGPVVSGGRLFLSCGSRALALNDGRQLWSRDGYCSSGDESAAEGPHVAADRSEVRSAGSGATLGVHPTQLQVLAPSLAVFQNGVGGALDARRGLLGARAWGGGNRVDSCNSSTCSRAIGAGADLYRVVGGRVLVSDLASGLRRWQSPVKFGSLGYEIVREPVAGDGLLVVEESDDLLSGWTSVLNPKPSSPQEGTFDGQIQLGRRAKLFGAIGRALRARGPAEVTLQADTFPFRRFKNAKRTRTFGDGGFGFSVRPKRNTRYRTVSGGRRSSGGTVFVYPRISERVRRGRGARINKLRSRVKVRVPRGVRLRGKRIALYLVRVSRRRVQRVGRARLSRGGRGTIRFNAIGGLRRRDFLFYCVRGLSRQGMGPRDVVDRRCGARRLPY